MRKVVSLFLVLSLLFGSLNLTTNSTAASVVNNVEPALGDIGLQENQETVIPNIESDNSTYADKSKNPVSKVLSDMTVSKDVYEDQRERYLIRFKKDYPVSIPSVVDSVYSDRIQGEDIQSDSFTELRERKYNLDIEQKISIYNVKSLESANALYMELKAEEVNQLLVNPMIASIEEDKTIQIAEDMPLTAVEEQPVKNNSQTVPWGNHSTGSYILREAKGIGDKSIKVAVFDTGITSHSDLHIAGGVSYVESSDSYSDEKGHGTHIAGTIAALNNEYGVVGIAPETELYAVKIADASGTGYISSVIQGIEWAIENNINIINMSFVSSQNSDALHEAIQRARSAGIVIVASAGNNGLGEDTIQYPAKYPEVIAVGAVDSSHHRTDFSATGAELDIVAPGFGIISTTMNGEYGVSSGTSNAAAHVTAAAALLWSHHKSWSGQQVVDKLLETATPLGASHETGNGLINVAKAEGIISGAIAPLSEENLSGLNTVLPSDPQGETQIAAYDWVNNGATIHPGESITVSLKLDGDQNGQNPHHSIIVEVASAANPNQVIATKTITDPPLHQPISYTWQTSSSTPTGTYHIRYRYPAFPSGMYDSIFVIYVSQPGAGEDTYEPNDTFLTAKHVYPENSYISYISSGSDIDYYKFTADKTGEIPIGVTIPSSVDYELDIYNESGVQVGSSSNGTGMAEHVNLQVAQNKTYYIKVTGFSGQFSSSPYTLTLGSIEVQPFLAPTGLEAVPYANSIKLSWEAMPDATSYKLRINGVDAGNTASTSYTFANLQSSQSYTLEVAAVYAAGTSSYASLQASTTLPELIVYQPEDVSQASRSSQLFSFKPATTGVYRIFTSPYQGTGAAVDTELAIYSSLQLTKQIAGNDDANDTVFSEITISLIGGQTYYIKVSGFDSTVLRTRITAEVISSSIPYIQLDHPVDINEQAGNSNVYVFVPANTGKFRIATGRFNGSSSSKANDTELSVFSDINMEAVITNGYNDDKANSTLSEVIVNLSAGVPYYIRTNEVNGGKTYARLLVTSAGQTSFTQVTAGLPIDLSKTSGEEAYLQFTPQATGQYRFFTSNYLASSQVNDTEILLYTDSDLKDLLDSNDDVLDHKPYGEQFSKLELNLTAGTTYYVVLRSFGSANGLQTRFTVENMEHADPASAVNLPFGELLSADPQGSPLSISSLYDTDYYKLELTAPDQISLYLSQGSGTIEDTNGNIRGYFSLDQQMSFDLDAGTYYLKIQSDWEGPAWGFSKFEYELAADINLIEYINEEGDNESDLMSVLRASSANTIKSFDATPGSGGSVKVQYKNKANSNKLKVEIRTANLAKGILVYEYTKSGDFNKGTLADVSWNGSVNPDSIDKRWYANYSDSLSGPTKYWAKDGYYKIFVSRLDGSKKKQPQEFLVQVINDPLNGLNLIPVPPTTENGKKITAKTKNCKSCRNYFDRFILHPNDHAYELEYGAWFAEVYGLTGIQKFAAGVDALVSCDTGTVREKLQCTLDNVGMIPVLGEGADAVNGVIYFVNGDYINALLSTGAIFPVVGNFISGTKKIVYTGSKKVTKIYKSNPCGCLPEGTKIETKDGLKPIEQIRVGDLVLSKDVDTGKQAYKPVEKLYSNEANEIYTLQVADTSIRTTGNHPFWIINKGWVPADELMVGDEVEAADGTLLKIDSISIDRLQIQTYNFTVTDYHSYYVSELGILTHNLIEVCELDNYKNLSSGKLTGRNSGGNSKILELEITKATGLEKPYNWSAHHIIPIDDNRFPQATELRNIMNKLDIDLNSSANGVFLPREKGVSVTQIDEYTLSTHNGSHAKVYYNEVLDRINPLMDDASIPINTKRMKVLNEINKIRGELLRGEIKLGNIPKTKK